MAFKLPVLNRRQALAGAGAFLLADFFLPKVARAAARDPKRKFVFAYFDGGWDLLLGLDPRDPATNSASTTQVDPGYAQLAYGYGARGVQQAGSLKLGPAVPP